MPIKPLFILLGILQIILLSMLYFYFTEMRQGGGTTEPEPEQGTEGLPAQGCHRSGCSGEICTDSGETVSSVCEFRPEFACYGEARCERQADGRCGFTETEALNRCIDEAQRPGAPVPNDTPVEAVPW